MSLAEVMEKLAHLTFEERQLVIQRALQLGDPGLSPDNELLVERRLAAHHADPESSLSLDQAKAILERSRSK